MEDEEFEQGAFLSLTHPTDSLDPMEIEHLVNELRDKLVALADEGFKTWSGIVLLNDNRDQRRVVASLFGGAVVGQLLQDDTRQIDEALFYPEELAVLSQPGHDEAQA